MLDLYGSRSMVKGTHPRALILQAIQCKAPLSRVLAEIGEGGDLKYNISTNPHQLGVLCLYNSIL